MILIAVFLFPMALLQGFMLAEVLDRDVPFLLAAELSNLYVVNYTGVKGIRIGEEKLLTSQLADDTCIYLKNQCQVNLVIQSLNIFSKASGLVVNTKKVKL